MQGGGVVFCTNFCWKGVSDKLLVRILQIKKKKKKVKDLIS